MKKFSLIILLLSLFSMQAMAQRPMPKTQVVWKVKDIDMGNIPQNKPATAAFEFTNTGEAPLIITDLKTTCGCTVADYPREPIAPGKSAKITATYEAEVPGLFRKGITIWYNGEDEVVLLTIHGTVATPPAPSNGTQDGH